MSTIYAARSDALCPLLHHVTGLPYSVLRAEAEHLPWSQRMQLNRLASEILDDQRAMTSDY